MAEMPKKPNHVQIIEPNERSSTVTALIILRNPIKSNATAEIIATLSTSILLFIK